MTIKFQQKYFIVAEKMFIRLKNIISFPHGLPSDRCEGEIVVDGDAMSVTVSQLFKGKGEPHFSSHLDTRTEDVFWSDEKD